jgi:menaquinone-dependent protoporphyrinogen oxidase
MSIKVLVAYGSKYGATAAIAEKIGQVLIEQGLEADVAPPESAGDPAGYAAFVVGSGAYYGRWRKSAAKFLKKNEELLSGMPVWIFSSGPTGEGDPVELSKGWRSPKSLEVVFEHIKPRDITLFAGMIDPEKLNSLEKTAIKKVEAPTGDFRDWDAIAEWAAGIARELKE